MHPDFIRAFFENSADGIVLFDEQQVILECNSAIERMFKVSRDEWAGRKVLELLSMPPDQLEIYKSVVAGRVRGEVIPPTELSVFRPDGVKLDIETSSFPMTVDQRSISVAIIRQISRRKQVQADLIDSQMRLTEAQEMGKIGDWTFDLATRRLKWSPQMYILLNRDPEHGAAMLRECLAYYTPIDIATMRQAIRHILELGGEERFEVKTRSGEAFHRVVVRGKLNSFGKVERLHGTVQDITAQKQLESQLIAEKQTLENIARSIGAGIAIISREFKTTWANQQLKDMYGSVQGKSCFAAYNGRNSICPDCGVLKIFEQGTEMVVHEQKGLDADGDEIWAQIFATPIRDENGDVTSAVELVIPVTDRKKAEAALKESEKKFRMLFEGARDAILLADAESGIVVDANDQATVLFQRSKAELIGRHQSSLHPPEDVHKYRTQFDDHTQGDPGAPVLSEILTGDGRRVPVEINANVITGPNQRKLLQGVFRDISERLLAENLTRAHADFLQQLIDAIPNPVYYTDADGRHLGMNRVFTQFTGVRPEEFVGKTAVELLPLEQHDLALVYDTNTRHLLQNPGAHVYEAPIILPDGSERQIAFHEATVTGSDGAVTGLVGVMVDMTEHKKMMRALQDNETKFRALFEHSPDAHLLSTDVFLDCNEKACQLWSCSRDDIVGHSPLEFASELQPDGRRSVDVVTENLARTMAGQAQSFYWQCRAVSGELIDTEVSLNAINLGDQLVVHGIIRDITARRRAEAHVRRLAAAVDQAAEGVVITDAEGSIEYVNPAFERMTAYSASEVLGHNPRLLKSGRHDSEFYRQMWLTLKDGRAWTGRLVNRRRDGSLYTENMTVSPVVDHNDNCTHYVAVKRDVTHELELEQMLIQSQKMEAVGRLAGGVAHDFNNLLTVIIGFSDSLARRLGPEHSLQADVAEIRKAADRASALTRQLLAFGRRQIAQRQHVNLNVIVSDMVKMLKRLIGENIELQLNLQAADYTLYADPGQLEQVIMNFVVNARDAMPNGGTITIATDNAEWRESRTIGKFELVPGRYLALHISDTGSGMSPETLEHIYEPFFTTKELGKGTGLGLATVYGIVQQHGGGIEIQSQIGLGSTFVLYLPLDAQSAVSAPGDRASGAANGRGESILLAEDDGVVRTLVTKMLLELGYKVTVYQDPEEALAHACRLDERIDLLLTDVIMPRMDGRTLAERVRVVRPTLKVLFMSGYTDKAITEEFLLRMRAEFIPKPFSRDSLGRKLCEILDRTPSSAPV